MKNTNVKKGGRVSDTVYNNDELKNIKIGFNAIANIIKEKNRDYWSSDDKASKFAQLWHRPFPIVINEITDGNNGLKITNTKIEGPLNKPKESYKIAADTALKALFYSQVYTAVKELDENEYKYNRYNDFKNKKMSEFEYYEKCNGFIITLNKNTDSKNSAENSDITLEEIAKVKNISLEELQEKINKMPKDKQYYKYVADLGFQPTKEAKEKWGNKDDLDHNTEQMKLFYKDKVKLLREKNKDKQYKIFVHITDLPMMKEKNIKDKISENFSKDTDKKNCEGKLKGSNNETVKLLEEKIEKAKQENKEKLVELVNHAKTAFDELISVEIEVELNNACYEINNNRKTNITSALVDLLNVCLNQEVEYKDNSGNMIKLVGNEENDNYQFIDNLRNISMQDKNITQYIEQPENIQKFERVLKKEKIDYLVDGIKTIFDYRFIPKLNNNVNINGIHKLHKLHKLKENKNDIQIKGYLSKKNPFQFYSYSNQYKKIKGTKIIVIPSFCNSDNKFDNEFYTLVKDVSKLLNTYDSELSGNSNTNQLSGNSNTNQDDDDDKNVSGGKKSRKTRKVKKVVKRKTRKAKKVVKRKTRRVKKAKKVVKRKTRRVKRG